jgi:hypothetical protein
MSQTYVLAECEIPMLLATAVPQDVRVEFVRRRAVRALTSSLLIIAIAVYGYDIAWLFAALSR